MKKKQKVVKKKAVKKNKNNPLKLNQDEILLGMCIFLKKISENVETQLSILNNNVDSISYCIQKNIQEYSNIHKKDMRDLINLIDNIGIYIADNKINPLKPKLQNTVNQLVEKAIEKINSPDDDTIVDIPLEVCST